MDLNNFNASKIYKETSIKTTDSGGIIVLLYEEIDKHLSEAISLLKEDKKHMFYDKVNYHITMAQKIITELTASLDSSKSKEIYDNLFNLYLYFNQQLSIANQEKDHEKITPIQTLVRELLGAWRVANKKTNTGIQEKRTGLNISG